MIKKISTATTGVILAFMGTFGEAQAAKIFYGDTKPLGNGNVRTWFDLDDNSNPLNIGIAFTEAALSGFPME